MSGTWIGKSGKSSRLTRGGNSRFCGDIVILSESYVAASPFGIGG